MESSCQEFHEDREYLGTRERLLVSAEEEFSLCGYEAATVRSICQRAYANVAAVKYHFGSKERLYAEVLLNFIAGQAKKYPYQQAIIVGSSPAERLEYFIGNFLRSMCCAEAQKLALAKLVLEEIVNPTPLFNELVTAVMEPIHKTVRSIIYAFLGDDACESAVRACSAGVMGQVLFYLQNRTIIESMYNDVSFDEAGLSRIIHHITIFSLGGIEHWKIVNNANSYVLT